VGVHGGDGEGKVYREYNCGGWFRTGDARVASIRKSGSTAFLNVLIISFK